MRLARLFSASMLLLHIAGVGRTAEATTMFDAPALSDTELDEARGGFTLPNGINVNFGVAVSTTVDGMRVLQTEFQLQGNDAYFKVTPASGDAITANLNTGQNSGDPSDAPGGSLQSGGLSGDVSGVGGSAQSGGASVNVGGIIADADKTGTINATIGNSQFALSRNGNVQISLGGMSVSTNGQSGLQIDVNRDAAQSLANSSGTNAIRDSAGATAVDTASQTPGATMTLGTNGLSSAVEMSQLLIQHEIGRQISAIVVNNGDNRVIDSQLTINLQLSDVQPMALGSSAFQIQALGLDAATWRGSGG